MQILRRGSRSTIGSFSGKSLLKTIQIIGYCLCREVVHNISFTSRSGTLHFLECFSHESGNQAPLSFRSLPVQFPLLHFGCQVIKGSCLLFFRSRSVCQNPESHQPTQFGIRTLFFIRHFYGCIQAFAAFQCIFFNQ